MNKNADSIYRYVAESEQPIASETIELRPPRPVQSLGKIIRTIIRKQDGYLYRAKKGGGSRENDVEPRVMLRSTEKVAARLGIDKRTLNKKLYHKDTTREWVIAIAAAFGLDGDQTSEALELYNFGGLDWQSDRERLIEDWLNLYAKQGKLLSLEELDRKLVSKGMVPIRIQKRIKPVNAQKNEPFSGFEMKSRIIVNTFGIGDDPYNSLETEYLPTSRCIASALIDAPDGKTFRLDVDQDGNADIMSMEDRIPSRIPIDHPDYMGFIPLLLAEAKKKKQWYDDIIRDSKNYKGRFSANLKDDSIHVFYEEFNYAFPERHEYYLMEYWRGKYTLSIAHESMFMQEYLSADDYFEHYHTHDRIKRWTYSSPEEIMDFLSKKSYSWEKEAAIKSCARAFSRLQDIVASKLEEIRSQRIFIRSAADIWDNPYEVFQFFGLEEVFNVKRDDEYGEMLDSAEQVTVDAGSANQVTITADEVVTAFNLGFKSFEQMCDVKRIHGAIEAVLS